MTNSQVAHIWAQQNKESGKGSNFYFEGSKIYSYGSHFLIAEFTNQYFGDRQIVYFTTRKYGNTTAKHMREVNNALFGLNIEVVYKNWHYGWESHIDTMERMRLDAKNAIYDIKNCRENTLETKIHIADTACNGMERYMLLFPELQDAYTSVLQELRILCNQTYDTKKAKIAANNTPAKIAAKQKLKAKKEAELAAKMQEKINEWRNGQNVYGNDFYKLPVMLRMSANNRIETSRGAYITERTARALYAHLKNGNVPPIEAGKDIDGFSYKSFDGQTLRIGCHEISMQEIELFANTQNW